MMGGIEKKTLASQVAEIIVGKINAGELVEVMPGENDLASEYNVSRRSVRGALQILEQNGVISATARGKRRQILKSTTKVKTKQYLVNVLLPKPVDLLHPASQYLLRLMRMNAEKSGYLFNVYEASYHGNDELSHSVEDVLSIHRCDVWVIWEVNYSIASYLHERGMKAVGLGGSVSCAEMMHMVYYDTIATIKHALNKLFSLGHRYVCFPYRGEMNKEIFEKSFAQYKIEEPAKHCFPYFDSTNEDYQRVLAATFSRKKIPTAMICSSDQLLTLVTWLGKHRLRIPEDVSVINIGYENYIDSMVPKMSYYSTYPKPLASKVKSVIKELLENKSYKAMSHEIFTEYVEGNSVSSL